MSSNAYALLDVMVMTGAEVFRAPCLGLADEPFFERAIWRQLDTGTKSGGGMIDERLRDTKDGGVFEEEGKVSLMCALML